MRKPLYLPKPSRPVLWVALAEFVTLIALWGTIIAAAVFFRAVVGG